MFVKDRIYGLVRIDEPVLVELLKSSPVQRLKKIEQFGLPRKYLIHQAKPFTRYEHSVGVLLLLRNLGASLEEQVAGLLHDVSHLAFSHLVDWVIADPKTEGHQDSIHQSFITKPPLSAMLAKYGFDPAKIANHKGYKLLDREIPDLCADRIDYAIREFKDWADPSLTNRVIPDLVIVQGQLAFRNIKTAEKFAKSFSKLLIKHWNSPDIIRRYHLLSYILKIGLQKKILSENDFYKNDGFVLKKIGKDKELRSLLALLEKRKLRIPDSFPTKGTVVVKKFRYVDPHVLCEGKLVRLSSLKPGYKKLIEKNRALVQQGIII